MSVSLTVLYIPVFIIALFGNITGLIIYIKTGERINRVKIMYLINLACADLSGKVFS
jgi:hypothetical protein